MKEHKTTPQEYEVQLNSVKELYSAVKLFVFDFGKKFDFTPGQFVMFELKDENGHNIKRSYSISSSPGKSSIELVINIIPRGKMTPLLDQLKVGDKIKLLGPYGKFGKDINSSGKDIMFIAAGTGITPIRSMINDLIENKFKKKISLLYGFRHEGNFLFKEEFEDLSDENSNFTLIPTVSRPVNAKHWPGEVGRVTDRLSKNLSSKDLDQEFYICGLGHMVRDTKKILLEKGVKMEQIHLEVW